MKKNYDTFLKKTIKPLQAEQRHGFVWSVGFLMISFMIIFDMIEWFLPALLYNPLRLVPCRYDHTYSCKRAQLHYTRNRARARAHTRTTTLTFCWFVYAPLHQPLSDVYTHLGQLCYLLAHFIMQLLCIFQRMTSVVQHVACGRGRVFAAVWRMPAASRPRRHFFWDRKQTNKLNVSAERISDVKRQRTPSSGFVFGITVRTVTVPLSHYTRPHPEQARYRCSCNKESR